MMPRMRDAFPLPAKELLAKRVGHRCSNPSCRQPTSGPQEDPQKAINIGVAAHISAASLGGPRYDESLTQAERSAIDNGIWLCQTCGKLVDNDPTRYTAEVLLQWKGRSEKEAAKALEVRRRPSEQDDKFSKIESVMPDLVAEMRKDLSEHPLCREFVVLKKIWTFWYPDRKILTYYYEDHPDLDSKCRILENLRLIRDIRHNQVARFAIEEDFAEYLSR